MIDELLRADELAKRLSVQPSTVHRWTRRGVIPAIRLSPKVVRYKVVDVVEALTQRQSQEGRAK